MKKIFLLTFFLFPLIFASAIHAQEYTMEEVAEHNIEGDCWMVFEDGVYDFSEYLPNHDKFMDIREWCGLDMTQDFRDKAGVGRDHREGTYTMLEGYYIGTLLSSEVEEEIVEEEEVDTTVAPVVDTVAPVRRYHVLPIFIVMTLLYWGSYVLGKKSVISIQKFNGFWNLVLLLLLLIPGLAYGIFFMLTMDNPDYQMLGNDFRYLHVDLSFAMAFVAVYHFIQRLPQFFAQLKSEN